MSQPAPPQRAQGHPSFGHWLFHVRKTVRLYGTLLRDPRVALWRKILFVGAVIILGVVLIIPDSIIIGFLGIILPIAGPAFGIPAGITADVAALAIALYAFLRIFFPKQIVQEHATALYGPYPDISPHTHNHIAPGTATSAIGAPDTTTGMASTMVAAPPQRKRSGGRAFAWVIFFLIVLGGAAWFLIHNNMVHI